jgi:hypothetical protein
MAMRASGGDDGTPAVPAATLRRPRPPALTGPRANSKSARPGRPAPQPYPPAPRRKFGRSDHFDSVVRSYRPDSAASRGFALRLFSLIF